MIRILFIMAFPLVLLGAACKNPNASNPAGMVTQPPRDTVLAEPDAADLLQTLQGKWQSEQDSTYLIEVAGSRMTHYNAGKVSGAAEIEIDGNCLSTACKVDSVDADSGWCFLEKGQFDVQCNLVLKCDKQVLKYRTLGATSPALVFRKR